MQVITNFNHYADKDNVKKHLFLKVGLFEIKGPILNCIGN
jgi:hypothetical protein